MKRILATLVLALAVVGSSFAQKWVDATKLTICGHTIKNAENPYSRLDCTPYNFENKTLIRYCRFSTGVYVMFKTNSTEISAEWSVASSKVRDNITAITQLGVDLYIKDNGKWRFCGVGRVSTDPEVTTYKKSIIKNMAEGDKEFMLYLPLWSEITDLKIGVDKDATIKAIPSPYKHRIVVYGSSTPHGASPSRPGLAMLARMSRDLNMDFVNFCFSGNAKLEMECADVLADCKTDAIICYCFGNPTSQQIEERVDEFTECVVKAHPNKPIIFIRPFHTPERFYDLKKKAMYIKKFEVIERKMEALTKQYKNVYYLNEPTAHGDDHEDTIDNSHLNDMGFDRILKVYEPLIAEILKKYGIKPNTK